MPTSKNLMLTSERYADYDVKGSNVTAMKCHGWPLARGISTLVTAGDAGAGYL